MAHKMPRRLVALSASAVATIYAAGLLSTRPAANGIAADAATEPQTSTDSTAAVPASDPTSRPAVVVGASAPVAATSTPVSTATPVSSPTPVATPTSQPAAAASTYANGTYSATGTSRLGNVTVSLTIADDRITNVQITSATTKYPVARIASLPAKVISAQSASINAVSGATYSSQAFRQAVQQALVQAHAAA